MATDFLKKNMESKNDEQLKFVLNNEHKFQEKEVKFAKEILHERGASISTTKDESNVDDDSLPESYHLPSSKAKYSLRGVATYQIVSSLIILPYFSFNSEFLPIQKVFVSLFFILYLAMFISGVLIYMKRKSGALIATITNLLQTVQFQMFGIYYSTTGFFHIFLNFGLSDILMFNLWGTQFRIDVTANPEIFFLGFNLVAIIATYLSFRAYSYWEDNDEFPLHLY